VTVPAGEYAASHIGIGQVFVTGSLPGSPVRSGPFNAPWWTPSDCDMAGICPAT
jgi:hypothetical protein